MDDMELMGDDELDELLGELDDDDDLMGARRRYSAYGRRGRARGRYLRKKLVPKTPGVPAPGARNWPLGFGSFTFVNAGVTTNRFSASPQRPFKGARLVVDVRRSAGALGELVTIDSLNVGQSNQLVAPTALPAAAFAPGAFQVMLALDPATPGIDITIDISVSAAPGVGETITVAPLIIGLAVG